jgi:uroporphyrinogen decarboxylase
MTPRERVRITLSRMEPDRVPLDLGTSVTSIHREAYQALRAHLGLPPREAAILDSMQQVVVVDEDVLARFHIDTRQIAPRPAHPWRPAGGGAFVDEWGVRWRPASEGRYYDMAEHPLASAREGDLDRYSWPDPEDPARFVGLAERARRLHEETDFAVVLSGFGEALFGLPSWVRGHTQFYLDLAEGSGMAEALLDRFLDYALRLAARTLSLVGPYVDVVRVADDLGTELGTIVSPETYRSLIKPRQRKLYELIKSRTRAQLLLHSCGAVRDLIDDFVDIGVDALNPVQVSARGMDSAALKQDFGQRIAFWGGGCDTQHVLPFGTVDEVRAEVRRRVCDLSPGGGHVFAAVHNIQFDVAPEKIVALYDTALEVGAYPQGGRRRSFSKSPMPR